MAETKIVLDKAEDGWNLPRLNQEEGTAFGWFDRWNMGTTPDGKYVVDLADWEARDMAEMLRKDYKSKQIENVLTLPVMSAEYTIIPGGPGDTGEAEWLKSYWETDAIMGGCRTSLDQIIGLMTSAFYYKRAYFEKVFATGRGKFEGKIVYDDVAFRPQTTCRLMRNPRNGRYVGFEQEAYYLGPEIGNPRKWPIEIKAHRAFVYTHGTRRDPLNGVSDMEVAFWAWKTKMKILMLWMQFLQGVALPRVIVKAQDGGTATAIAKQISRMKASGVLPVATPGSPDQVGIDPLDLSGKGSDQFMQAIQWLDTASTASVLAGFLDLTGMAAARAGGKGSYALSADASDFFLQSLEAKTREMEDQIRRGLFAPLIFHNFGANAVVPRLQFEPLNDIDKATAVTLLQAAMAAPPGGPVPVSFIADLAGQVAAYLGLDGEKTAQDFQESFAAAAAQAQAKALADAGTNPAGATPTGQHVAGLAGAVNAAHQAIQAGVDPKKANAQANQAHARDTRQSASLAKADQARNAMLVKHAKNAVRAKTGGTVSLSNEESE